MSWPPWWLILAWIVMVPLGIRALIDPTRGWSRPKREWAEDHPGDDYSSGWSAQTRLQVVVGLGLVGLCTVGWLLHVFDPPHKDAPSHALTRPAGAITVMPDFSPPTAADAPVTRPERETWHSLDIWSTTADRG